MRGSGADSAMLFKLDCGARKDRGGDRTVALRSRGRRDRGRLGDDGCQCGRWCRRDHRRADRNGCGAETAVPSDRDTLQESAKISQADVELGGLVRVPRHQIHRVSVVDRRPPATSRAPPRSPWFLLGGRAMRVRATPVGGSEPAGSSWGETSRLTKYWKMPGGLIEMPRGAENMPRPTASDWLYGVQLFTGTKTYFSSCACGMAARAVASS